MVEVVFALLLIVDNKIVEHRIQDNLSSCLKAKRYAMKDKGSKDRVTYQCLKSKKVYDRKIYKTTRRNSEREMSDVS